MFSLKDILDQVTVHKLEKMAIVMYNLKDLQEQVTVQKLVKSEKVIAMQVQPEKFTGASDCTEHW